jgi:hypothetical protein
MPRCWIHLEDDFGCNATLQTHHQGHPSAVSGISPQFHSKTKISLTDLLAATHEIQEIGVGYRQKFGWVVVLRCGMYF